MTPKIPAEPNQQWCNTLACIGNPLPNLRYLSTRYRDSVRYRK